MVWAVDGLQALLLLRDELRELVNQRQKELREAGGLLKAPNEFLDELARREIQVREVLIAFLSQGKVLLDLLSMGVAAALGNPGGFAEKHGSRGVGVRLAEYALTLGVAAPEHELVERARDLDRRIADVRDDLIVHPRLEGEHARKFLLPRGKDLWIEKLFPEDDEGGSAIPIDELDAELEAYTRELVRWVASVLAAAPTFDKPG